MRTLDHEKTALRRFDPNRYRLDRDIRNSMSRALCRAVAAGSTGEFTRCAEGWMEKALPAACRQHIKERESAYGRIDRALHGRPVPRDASAAVVLWNHRSYFECHEWLEPFWQQAYGALRSALKGWIQAAGAYVLLEAGRHTAAVSLSKKAGIRLRSTGYLLVYIDNLAALIDSLESGTLRQIHLNFTVTEGFGK